MPGTPIQTDFERWRDAANSWGARNPLRSKIAGSAIPPGSSVLDIGAGSMVLKQYLDPSCGYQPCDLYPRTPGCLVADLNRDEFPKGRHYDWAVMLGVLQFLENPGLAASRCREVADNGVFSYPTATRDEPEQKELDWRRQEGWFNALSEERYVEMVRNAGWRIIKGYRIPANVVLICKNE